MTERPWYRRFLAWARVEDEHGVLSLTTAAFVIGCICLFTGRTVSLPELAAFALGLGAYHAKRHLRHRQAEIAMGVTHEGAMLDLRQRHEAEMQKRSDQADGLLARVDQVEKQVRDLATPERVEAMRSALGRGRSG